MTSLHVLIKHTQLHYFADEFRSLELGQVSKRFQNLSPFVDDRVGLLRVGGRLQLSTVAYSSRHPILLPNDSHLTRLIVEHFHILHMHAGTRTLQAFLGQHYWIVSSRRVVRACISRCLVCTKLRAKIITPAMGNLPHVRVSPCRPFANVGIDYAGPFVLKESGRRNARTFKGYFCLFVCMSTKAVHLEPVSELSTGAFLATFDRFVSRRGLCRAVYSDCGTNFLGASRHLGEVTEFWRTKDVQRDIGCKLAQRSVEWNFIPPGAPHFGGLWESGVKRVKFHLTRVIGERPLTYEEFATVLCKIEAILNSRPLSPPSADLEDLDYLTPGHFLIGAPLLSVPEFEYGPEVTLHKRWQLLRQIAQHFWRRWSLEYLQTLQQRSKWTVAAPNVSVGDLVFLITPNAAPLSWPCGVVTTVFPGEDGSVRVVDVKTAAGTYRRPVRKLVALPPLE